MNVGVFLNQYYAPDGDFAVTDLYEQADALERLGFDSVAVGERHVHEEGVVEPLTALAALAGRTDELQLATTALVPALHHPVHLAEQVAAVDRLSDGRMAFGAALGYRERELAPFGVQKSERAERFVESLSVLERLWSEGAVSHDGPRHRFEDVVVEPKPRPEMPVWIGGHADVAIERAAYRGDGWIASASSTPADLERQLGVYEDALAEFGEDRADHEVVLMRDCFVADSRAAAREAVEPHVVQLYEWYARWGQTYMDEHDVEVDFDELAGKFVLGPPAECVDRLERYAEMGVDHVLLRCQFPGQSQAATTACLERLGDEVLPEVQS